MPPRGLRWPARASCAPRAHEPPRRPVRCAQRSRLQQPLLVCGLLPRASPRTRCGRLAQRVVGPVWRCTPAGVRRTPCEHPCHPGLEAHLTAERRCVSRCRVAPSDTRRTWPVLAWLSSWCGASTLPPVSCSRKSVCNPSSKLRTWTVRPSRVWLLRPAIAANAGSDKAQIREQAGRTAVQLTFVLLAVRDIAVAIYGTFLKHP